MMVALLTFALAAPALLFAGWPLLARRVEVAAPEDEHAALETEKLQTLRALRELDLDRQAGHVEEEDYAASRASYEAQAADVLRRLDALGPRRAVAPAAPSGRATPWTRQPVVLGATGVALLVFGVVLGVLLSRHTGPPAPEMTAAGPEAAPGPVEPAIMPPAGSSPGAGGAPRPLPKEVLEGMLRAAHASLDAGRYQEAIAAYRAVLKRDSRNVDAITHLGVILAIAGHRPEALEAFDRALAIDPDYPHALWDKAGVLDAMGELAGVVTTLERFIRVVPAGPDRDQAEARLREARARQAAAPAAPPAPGAKPKSAP